jgi:phage baseplate assembly protein W
MVARADRHTQRSVVEEMYSDVPINFDKNPITGNLAKVTNEQAVKGSIVQIVLAMRGEWPHYGNLGSNVYRSLFEPVDAITAEAIKTTIHQALNANEPRAKIERVQVETMRGQDGYNITVWFYLINSTDQYSVSTILKRIR